MRVVPNFVGGTPLETTVQRFGDEANVLLTQYGASMAFQHTMTPAQARQLAAYLVECADLLEPRQMPEGVPV